ncbi:MAG: urate oxidase [Actinomycetota bacterium]|nr:urate oxidase [Actinomycetota bacterium]
MGIVLGANEYGKAETRVVRIARTTTGDGERHDIRDLNVSTALSGDFSAAHLAGDQSDVLPTDTQKNTVFAFAKENGVGEIEDFALTLAWHFVDEIEPVRGARVEIDTYAWDRIEVDGRPHNHAFVRRGQEIRSTVVTADGSGVQVVSGLRDLVLLKSTGSEFKGFLKDRYTTLAETDDRIMATSLAARWRHTGTSVDWAASYEGVRTRLLSRFAEVHSLALQQTLWEMGRAVLEADPQIAEISLSAPNRHHFAVDLTPFGLDNPNEVFFAADRPYGLIQATITRDD